MEPYFIKNDQVENMKERSGEDRTREKAQARLCEMIKAKNGDSVNVNLKNNKMH